MKLSRNEARIKRKVRIRKRIFGTAATPRLTVYRSNKNIYAQLIDDAEGKTLCAACTKNVDAKSLTKESSKEVGKLLAKKALEANLEKVVFDRNGFIFHGKVKALADGAREAGLKF